MSADESGSARAGLAGWPALAGAAVVLSAFNFSLMVCACGHLGVEALPGSAGAATMAWLAFVKTSCAAVIIRLALMAGVVLITLILLKNVGDVLWFGHGPVFAAPWFARG